MEKLNKCEANYAALTPITMLKRASMCYADRTSIIYGQARFTWRDTYVRCRRLASSLNSLGIAKNDVVSFIFTILSPSTCWYKFLINYDQVPKTINET